MNLHSICVVLMIFSFTEANAVTPVKELDITKYLGLWYEMYYNQFAANVQGSDIFCTTAQFTDNGNGTVALLFLQRLQNETGPLDGPFTGTAVQVGTGGNFTIKFDSLHTSVPYWVISLGPEKDGLYEYSVATDPFKMGLYVLARDVATFRMKYEHEVLLFVREQGFILPINKPIAIPQNDKCLYPPTVKVTPVAELNITKYLGRWYEMYYNQFAANVQGTDIFCTTAQFTDNGNGTVALLFLQRLQSETGPLDEPFPGTAVQDGKGGKFTIKFDRLPTSVPYWVISLGPEKDGLYEYSVATDPFKMGLYVLARDVATFKLKYEQEVLLFVRKQGFILPINKPIPIPQNDKCLYPPKTLNHDSSEL